MTLTLNDGTPRPEPYQSWLDAAKVPLPTNDIVLHLARCPQPYDAVGCSTPGQVWVQPDEGGWWWTRRTFMHEMGHQFDHSVMTDEARRAANYIRDDPRPWRSEPNSPHEQFAEAWWACATWIKVRRVWPLTFYDYTPRPAVHRDMCRLMRWAALGYFK